MAVYSHSTALTIGATGVNTANPGGNSGQSAADWLNPGNVVIDTDAYSDSGVGNNKETDFLDVSDFSSASVPTDAVITGIEIRIDRNATNSADATDSDIILFNGATEGSNLAAGASLPQLRETVTYGGSTEMWGLGIDPADLANLKIRQAYDDDGADTYLRIYTVKAIIHYTLEGLGDELGWWCPTIDDQNIDTTTLLDITNTGNDGTLTNMTPTLDWVDDTGSGGVRALDLDGTDDYISIGDVPAFELTGDITMSAWIKVATYDAASPNVVMSYGGDDASETSANNVLWLMGHYNVAATDLPITLHESGSGTDDLDLVFSALPSTGTWYHLLVTRNGTAKEIQFYVDGVAFGTAQSYVFTPDGGTSAVMEIARWNGNDGTCMDGRIDDVRLYDRVLASSEITHLATSRGIQGQPESTANFNYTLLNPPRWGVVES